MWTHCDRSWKFQDVWIWFCALLMFVKGAEICSARAARSAIDLSGSWRVQLASGERQERWEEGSSSVAIDLPGSLTENRVGNEVTVDTPWMGSVNDRSWYTADQYAPYREPGNIKIPYWLQPVKYYTGRAWYRREVTIPAQWRGKRIILHLERCHWETTVWVGDRKAGSCDSLGAPHEYDLTELLSTGRHTLTIRVENGYLVRVGIDAHSVTDHTQTNWNGIIGAIELRATDKVWLDDMQAHPNVKRKMVQVRIRVGNETGEAGRGAITLRARAFNSDQTHAALEKTYSFDFSHGGTEVKIDYPLGDGALAWDEFDPALYHLEVTLKAQTRETRHADRRELQFGLREFGVEGTHFTINGRRTFLRGTLECCIFPKTGYPAMDVEAWRRIFRVCKSHGLNHMRFHSWCPPEAAFIAADEEGMYLQIECGVWRGAGGAEEARPVEPWLYEETQRILREYGNHPSFVLLAHGNEPWELDRGWMNEWVKHFKAKDDRRLVTSGAHYPLVEENEFHVPGCAEGFWMRYHGYLNPTPPSTLRNYTDQVLQRDVPCIAHEVGQWCVFPNLEEISKYTGVLKARNFEIVRDFLEQNHMLDQAKDFLMASGKFQALLYKEEIEAFLRTPELGGFQLLDLHDFPGQGTALVGVLDPFWDSKGYVTPEQFRRFCGPVVPLAVMEKRVWTHDETFEAEIRIAQYSARPLENARPVWTITDRAGAELGRGDLKTGTIPVGGDMELGRITFQLSGIRRAMQLKLTVTLPGTEYTNDWAFWVYPKTLDTGPTPGVAVCETLEDALERLERGEKVLLAPGPGVIAGNTAGTFQPIFWNKAWFPNQKEHTLGVLCDPKHPALARFPTEIHGNWQWWDLMNNGKPIVLDELPPELHPIIQPIDDWNTSRRLGLLIEARVGAGRLMLCSIDLTRDLDRRPVARQLRHSLQRYMASEAFAPQYELSIQQLRALITHRLLAELDIITGEDEPRGTHPR